MKPPALPESPQTYLSHLRRRPLPTISDLRHRFRYDPSTGIIWERCSDMFDNGTPAATRLHHGYRYLQLNRQQNGIRSEERVHRVAFALMQGRWPHLIDHINRDKTDNRWTNLRETTASGNQLNTRAADSARHICKTFTGHHTQDFAWQVSVSPRSTSRRDFCAAWHVRQQWLAERKAVAPLADAVT